MSHYLVSCQVTETYDAGGILCCQVQLRYFNQKHAASANTYDAGGIQCCQVQLRYFNQKATLAPIWYLAGSRRLIVHCIISALQVRFSIARSNHAKLI
jgi:hypothetical protein